MPHWRNWHPKIEYEKMFLPAIIFCKVLGVWKSLIWPCGHWTILCGLSWKHNAKNLCVASIQQKKIVPNWIEVDRHNSLRIKYLHLIFVFFFLKFKVLSKSFFNLFFFRKTTRYGLRCSRNIQRFGLIFEQSCWFLVGNKSQNNFLI